MKVGLMPGICLSCPADAKQTQTPLGGHAPKPGPEEVPQKKQDLESVLTIKKFQTPKETIHPRKREQTHEKARVEPRTSESTVTI